MYIFQQTILHDKVIQYVMLSIAPTLSWSLIHWMKWFPIAKSNMGHQVKIDHTFIMQKGRPNVSPNHDTPFTGDECTCKTHETNICKRETWTFVKTLSKTRAHKNFLNQQNHDTNEWKNCSKSNAQLTMLQCWDMNDFEKMLQWF